MKLFKLSIILISLLHQETYSVSGQIRNCATLYSKSGFNHVPGLETVFKDGALYGDLRDQYFVDSTNKWNETGSFTVENGCSLRGCNQSYFQGNCQQFNDAVNNLNTSGMETFLSASCTCEKNCTCSDIRVRKSSCAYAILGEGCDDTCDPYYIELKGSEPFFPTMGIGKVNTIKVREGCSLTLYDQENYEGNETELNGGTTFKNWTGIINSHQCTCSETHNETGTKTSRPLTYPALIDIPKDMDGISSLVNGNFTGHPGLMAALNSLKHKRSSRNAYILVLGSTGSGKSTIINYLFDNPNMTLAGEAISTTSDIIEFRVPVPIDELGMRNSEIRVIDTPGLGDTRGLEYDAKFLATLDKYLSSHEELHNRIPNVVLILHKFSDNRFSGDGARFVKMLRGLSSFRGRLVDENYSNVLFLLTHFCQSLPEVSKNPEKNLQEFRAVIEDYSLFPKPVSIVVTEDKGVEYDLPKTNGNFKLPNGVLYPENLFDKIDLLTSKGKDPVGKAIIRNALTDFVYHEDYNVTTITQKLVDESNDTTVQSYLKLLTESEFNVENTEVSQLLATAYATMDSNLKQRYPGSLQYLQKALNIRSIRTKSDVPKTPLSILELLHYVQKNGATLHLLEKALSIKPPEFKQQFITGEFGSTTPTFKSPFKESSKSLRITEIGYTFPSLVTLNVVSQVKDNFVKFKNPKEYLDHRRKELGIKVTDSVYPAIPNFHQYGYNILPNSTTTPVTLSAVREFRTFRLDLNDNVELSKEFSDDLKTLSAFDEENLENVKQWRKFFIKYGTFIVKSVYGGGSIEIQAVAKNASMISTISQSIFDIIDFADKVVLNGRSRLDLSNIAYSLSFKGGDTSFHRSTFANMSIDSVSSLLGNWTRSLTLRPVFLMTGMQLLPLGDLAKKVGQNVSSEVQDVTNRLVNSNLRYNPSKRVIVALDNCKSQLIEAAKAAVNHTTVLNNEIKNINAKIKEFFLKTQRDSEKTEKEIRDLDAEIVTLKSTVAEKATAVVKRKSCEAHKMTSYKYA